MASVPTAHIKLTRSQTETANAQYLKVFRLRVDVVEIKGISDDRVFIYSQQPLDPYTQLQPDWFQAVCSAVDMVEYPGGAPSDSGDTPFFRLNYVELDFRSLLEAEEFWQLIQQEVCILCQALDAVQTLAVTESVWCCSPPDHTDSLSESTSQSQSVSQSHSA